MVCSLYLGLLCINASLERTCAICHKSSLKGDRGLRVHQRVSKECLRAMRDTQQEQSVVSSSDRNEEEDEFSVASYKSNASNNELVDFMDDFIGKISQLAQNRVNVVHVQVPKAFVDTLRYLNNEIFNRETFKHIINRLATVIKKVAVAFGRFMFHIVVFVFVVILFRQILYHSVNLWMHIMFKEEAPAVIHEFWTRLQNRPPLF